MSDLVKIISYLTLLEISTDTILSEELVRRQYRKLAQIYHPDTSNARYSDGKKFQELKNAEEYLLNNINLVNTLIENGFSETKNIDKNEKQYNEQDKKEKKASSNNNESKENEEKDFEQEKSNTLNIIENIEKKYENIRNDYYEKDYKLIKIIIESAKHKINNAKTTNDLNEIINQLNDDAGKILTIKGKKKRNKMLAIILAVVALIIASIVIPVSITGAIRSNKLEQGLELLSNGKYSDAKNILHDVDYGKYNLANAMDHLNELNNNQNNDLAITTYLKTIDANVECFHLTYSGDGQFIYDYKQIYVTYSFYNILKPNDTKAYKFQYWKITELVYSKQDDSCDIRLTAQWEPIDYTITYYSNYDAVHRNPLQYNVESNVTFTNPECKVKGYDFVGWTTTENGTNYVTSTKGLTGNLSLYANWVKTKYDVKFYDSKNKIIFSTKVAHGDSIEFKGVLPTKEPDEKYYYVFKNWDIDLTNITKNIDVKPIFEKYNKNIKFKLENNICSVSGYAGNEKEIFIPSTYEGYIVSVIDASAFENQKIEIIHLPDTIKRINEKAFYNSALKTINIPKSVTAIETMAFANTDLTNIVLNSNIKTISKNLFKNCSKLTNFTIPSTVESIEYGAFYGTNISRLTIPKNTKLVLGSLAGMSTLQELSCNGIISEELTTENLWHLKIYYYGFGYLFGSSTYENARAISQWTKYKDYWIHPEKTIENSIYSSTYYIPNTLKRININGNSIGPMFLSGDIKGLDIKTYSVTVLEENSYYKSNLEYIVLNSTIKRIKSSAFSNTSYNIYYLGTSYPEEDFYVDKTRTYLYSSDTPKFEGNYWHYINGVPTPWDN